MAVSYAPIPDLPVLPAERGSSTSSGHSSPCHRMVGSIRKRSLALARHLPAIAVATAQSRRKICLLRRRLVIIHPSAAIAGSVSVSSSALASLRSAVSKPSVNQV
jgi:hypothetical protein